MLNIINSFQNKDGDRNILNQAPNFKNNDQLNIQQKYEFQLLNNNNYQNIDFISDKNKNQDNNELIINKKAQNIQLICLIKKDGEDIKKTSLDVKLENYFDNKNIISIQIVDNNDPLFIYDLNIDEYEYQQLKKAQSLFIEFKNFSDFIVKMLNNCLKDNFNCFINIKKNEETYLIIEEQTQFRKLNHLTLKFNSTNNVELKNRFNRILNDYKNKYEIELIKNKEITENLDKIKTEKTLLESDYEKLKNENEEKIKKIYNDNIIEVNNLKDNNTKQKEELNRLKINIDYLNKDKSKLSDNYLDLKKSYEDLEEKYNNIFIESEEKSKLISDLKNSNNELNNQIKNFKLEKSQLENKNEELENEKRNNEDIIKNLKLISRKMENKLKISINEINKANDIIEKFQNEIKNIKSKNKLLKNEINKKNELIKDNQIIIENQENTINDIKKQMEEKEEELLLIKKDIEKNNMIKDEDDNKINENNNINQLEKDNFLKNKIENLPEKDLNNFNQSNSEYNPSYYFTFYNNIHVNSSRQTKNKKNNNFTGFIKTDDEKSNNNEIEENENKNYYENVDEKNIINKNIYGYQFRQIKGNYFNEHPKKRDYFSNLPFIFQQTDISNNLNQNK